MLGRKPQWRMCTLFRVRVRLLLIVVILINFMRSGIGRVKYAFATTRDLWRLLGKQMVLFGTVVVGANYLYKSEGAREFVRNHATEYLDSLSSAASNLLK